MDIVGIDIARAKFDAALLIGGRIRHGAFSNTEAGFEQFLVWFTRHRPDPTVPLHACMEATGNWGLDLAAFLHGCGVQVSIVNPARIKAFGESELARNKTDRLDAALIARFCRAHAPAAWVPPAPHLRELRDPRIKSGEVRRCDALKATRVQELNRKSAGFVSPAVAASIAAHLAWLDEQIEAVMQAVRSLVAADPVLARNLALVRSITGFGEVSATILLAELPNIAEFTPKALAAFAGLSPSEHSSGVSVRRPGKISRVGSERLRGTLYMCALSAKRTNKALAAFVQRMTAAGKPPKSLPPDLIRGSSSSPSPASCWSTPMPSSGRRSRSIPSRRPLRGLDPKHGISGGSPSAMDRQTLRDWVHRYNVEGVAGLSDRAQFGRAPKLTVEQEAEVAELVRAGPSLATHGVIRWRRKDLAGVIERRFGAVLAERSVGAMLKRLGFRRLSVRPRHPGHDIQAQASFGSGSPPS